MEGALSLRKRKETLYLERFEASLETSRDTKATRPGEEEFSLGAGGQANRIRAPGCAARSCCIPGGG